MSEHPRDDQTISNSQNRENTKIGNFVDADAETNQMGFDTFAEQDITGIIEATPTTNHAVNLDRADNNSQLNFTAFTNNKVVPVRVSKHKKTVTEMTSLAPENDEVYSVNEPNYFSNHKMYSEERKEDKAFVNTKVSLVDEL